MNIFATYDCPEKSAMVLDDRKLRKMCIETTQMMCANVRRQVGELDYAYTYNSKGNLSKHRKPVYRMFGERIVDEILTNKIYYLETHYNHPCTIWARQSFSNMLWLFNHGVALCDEYAYRFDKEHGSKDVLYKCSKFLHKFPHIGQTPFVNATTNHKHIEDVHIAYRECLKEKWNHLDKFDPIWTKNRKPAWYIL